MNRRLRWMVAVSALSLLVAACGDDGAAATTAGTTAAPTTTITAATTTNAGGGGDVTEIDVSGFAFRPGDLTITPGTTVHWANQDAATHTTSSDDNLWNQSLAGGATFEFTFETPGTYTYHCNIHPSMTGTITVTS